MASAHASSSSTSRRPSGLLPTLLPPVPRIETERRRGGRGAGFLPSFRTHARSARLGLAPCAGESMSLFCPPQNTTERPSTPARQHHTHLSSCFPNPRMDLDPTTTTHKVFTHLHPSCADNAMSSTVDPTIHHSPSDGRASPDSVEFSDILTEQRHCAKLVIVQSSNIAADHRKATPSIATHIYEMISSRHSSSRGIDLFEPLMLVCSLSARVRTHRYNHSRYSIAHCTFTLRALVSYTHQLLVCSQPYCYASPKPTDDRKTSKTNRYQLLPNGRFRTGTPPRPPPFSPRCPNRRSRRSSLQSRIFRNMLFFVSCLRCSTKVLACLQVEPWTTSQCQKPVYLGRNKNAGTKT